MTTESLTALLYDTVSSVLGIPADQISDSTGAGTIEQWDSLSQLNIIMSIEEAFGVAFEPEQMLEMSSVNEIRKALLDRFQTN
jgi:acyl carrier protein